ncbi:SDR family NAD(P)-dependent oxidoreductase [Nitratifractor salsuginis]|uniref:Short-chain dehydrogenase/reductase SDR n=1 Tax=Nitratifractor salsuginis (strain DSM 16511 / JCM 12458 / E9I37-1) TaxID=749222 RepID=E6WYU8_NITSE|nr:SDR family NAD(P)-dependent oxidoreductase [Nitratifractor salsuginis]ADV46534.1 short-chain dehydrogenase/reductase SDR [Nitratifractor salsuginis DSM 16511]
MSDETVKQVQKKDQPVVVITGCSSGIGRVTAEYLRERFCTVYPTARTDEEVRELEEAGFEGAMRLDVRKPEEIAAVIREVLKREGRIDVWFNNAGYGQMGAVEDLPLEALREQFETNVIGLHECTRQILQVMRKQGRGKIIQHSSVLGLVALPFRGAYNASKYAVEGLTDTLRLELHGSGIYVSLLNTGPVTSRFRENAIKTLSKIDIDKSRWRSTYYKALRGESRKVPFNLPPEAVASVVHQIVLSDRPAPRYYITKATWMLGIAKRLLNTRLLDRLLLRV